MMERFNHPLQISKGRCLDSSREIRENLQPYISNNVNDYLCVHPCFAFSESSLKSQACFQNHSSFQGKMYWKILKIAF
jgi:hypothetical protein